MSQSRSFRAALGKLQEFGQQYQPAMDIDRYVQLGEDKVQKLLGREQQVRDEIQAAEEDLSRLSEELALATDAAFIAEIGYYEPRYDLEDVTSH